MKLITRQAQLIVVISSILIAFIPLILPGRPIPIDSEILLSVQPKPVAHSLPYSQPPFAPASRTAIARESLKRLPIRFEASYGGGPTTGRLLCPWRRISIGAEPHQRNDQNHPVPATAIAPFRA